MAILGIVLLALGLLCLPTIQQEELFQQGKNGVWWIYPTQGQTFNPLDTVNVSWRAPFEKPTLYTFCTLKSVTYQIKKTSIPTPGDGFLLVQLDFTADEACWFNLRPGENAEGGSNSPRYGVRTEPRPNLTTIGAVIEAGTTPTSAAASATTGTPATTTSTTTPTTSTGSRATSVGAAAEDQTDTTSGGSEGLTLGTKIGIGIGVAIGSILLFTGVFFLGRRSSQRGAPDTSVEDSSTPPPASNKEDSLVVSQSPASGSAGWTLPDGSEYKSADAAGYYYQQQQQQQQSQELPDQHQQHQYYAEAVGSTLGTSHNAAELAGQLPYDRAAELQESIVSPVANRAVENDKYKPPSPV